MDPLKRTSPQDYYMVTGDVDACLQRLRWRPGPFQWSSYKKFHYVITSAMASQITGISIVYSTVCSGADQRKHQSSAPLTFMMGIHRWSVNSAHRGPVTRKMFPFDDVMVYKYVGWNRHIPHRSNYKSNWTIVTWGPFRSRFAKVIQGDRVWYGKIPEILITQIRIASIWFRAKLVIR